MRDKSEIEIQKVLKKHGEFITFLKYNQSKQKKIIESIDIKLRPTVVIYLIDFNKKSARGTDADIVNRFNVTKSDILNGSFAKSFDGFSKYDSNGKLSLMMGLGYVFGSDIEIITPKMVGNVLTEGMNLFTILNAVDKDLPEIYRKKETPSRKTDFTIGVKQGPAGIGATKRKKEEVVTWVFSVHEIIGISERSGSPIFAKGKEVKVRRAYYDSAQNFVKHKYSYQKTKKHYFVELQRVDK